jgi:hypothetical protein
MRLAWARDDMTYVANRFSFLGTKYDPYTWNDSNRHLAKPRGYFTDRVLMGGNGRHFLVDAEQLRRLSNIGIAAALHHQDHSRWPNTLTELEGKYLQTVPMDAKDDAPFVVKPIGNGLMIFPVSFSVELDRLEAEGALTYEASRRIIPVLFLGDALKRIDAAAK